MGRVDTVPDKKLDFKVIDGGKALSALGPLSTTELERYKAAKVIERYLLRTFPNSNAERIFACDDVAGGLGVLDYIEMEELVNEQQDCNHSRTDLRSVSRRAGYYTTA